MKKIIYALFVCAAVVFIFHGCKKEEQPGSIYGTVTDKATGNPIQNAGVELQSIGKKTVTGSEGQFEFTEVAVGEYDLYVTKTGYTDVKASVVVTEGQSVQSDIQMEKLPAALRVVDDNGNDISELDFGNAEDVIMKLFNIFNDGTSTLEWEISYTANWIASVSKTSGTLNAGATQAVNITIDRSLLQSGENTTILSITSNDGSKQLTLKAVNGTILPTLNTHAATNVTSSTATFNGEILTAGTPTYTERGFVYATTSMPTIETTIERLTAPVTSTNTFSALATNLTVSKTTYYVRAYAINSAGVAYSTNQITVQPQTLLPSLTTQSVTYPNLSAGTATFNGNITSVGDPAYTERGFVYGTSHNPDVENDTKRVVSGNGLGAFSANVAELVMGNIYYVRSYATNTAGTGYGEEVVLTFTATMPTVSTQAVTSPNIGAGTATFNGSITSAGDPAYTERGFVYSISHNPDIENDNFCTVSGNGTGAFSKNVTGLTMGNTYYVRAYAANAAGTAYGEEVTLNFTATMPTVTTQAATSPNIGAGTATFNGSITSAGDPAYTERGFVYGISHSPNVNDDTKKIASGSGTGTFSSNVTGLTMGSTYYIRAYATNTAGTAYGLEVTLDFTATMPTVTTQAATSPNIGAGTAMFNGTISDVGDPVYTERGFVYGILHNPNVNDDTKKIASGSGTGTFSSNVTGLTMGSTYYIRAYATNTAGTAYGLEVTLDFTAVMPEVTTDAISNIDRVNGTATFNGTISDVGDPAYTERGFVYGIMPVPVIGNGTKQIVSGTISGAYAYSISGLAETTYYIRAYAISTAGTVYGDILSIDMAPPGVFCAGCGPGATDLWVAFAYAGVFTWGPTANTGARNESDGMINMNTIRAIDNDFSSYPAFQACANMGTGWYLPSTNELYQLYVHRFTIGGFTAGPYWSSTEINSVYSYSIRFSTSEVLQENKNNGRVVRCVRRN